MRHEPNPAYDSTPERDDALQRFYKAREEGEAVGVTEAELRDLVKHALVEEHSRFRGKLTYDITYVGRARLSNIGAAAAQVVSAAKVRQFVADLQRHLHELGSGALIDTDGATFGEFLRKFEHYSWRNDFYVKDETADVSVRIEVKERGAGGLGVSTLVTPKGVFDIRAGGYDGRRFGSRKGIIPAREIAEWVIKNLEEQVKQKIADEERDDAHAVAQKSVDDLHRHLGIAVDNGRYGYDPGCAHVVVSSDGASFELKLPETLTFEQAQALLKRCRELKV